jgi:membrane protease YdiL (CAAX protease family)
MLFLLKRTWAGAVAGWLVLALLGVSLRTLFASAPALGISWWSAALGLGVVAAVLVSDLLLHGLFLLTLRDWYRQRHRQLVEVFKGQSLLAALAGAGMAGGGEEWLFRGLSTEPVYLMSAAVVFGLLHHIRGPLWPFTVWAVYQGLLFALALFLTQCLFVTMLAHFLHDLAGFLIFRYLNRNPARLQGAPPVPVP